MSLKEKFQFKDRLIKGIDRKGQFKISVVKTTKAVQTAKENHNLSLLATTLLGRSMTAAMLLASELKGEERIHLKLEGNGPLGMVSAEANRVGEMRGYVRNPSAKLDYSHPEVEIGDGLGIGLLSVSKILYNEAEPRNSTIQLVKGDVITDVAHFLAQSEQVLSAVLIDISLDDHGNVKQSGGLLIQRLPDAEDSTMTNLQETLSHLPPIAELLEKDYYIDDIMEMATSPYQVKELDRQPVDFFCRCSPKRFKNALTLLSYDELKDMKGESQEMVCHYCGKKHIVSEKEIEQIVKSARAKMN